MSPCFLLPLLLVADPPPAADPAADKIRQEEVARLAPGEAKRIELFLGADTVAKADLVAKPLLRWSNPTAGSVYGEVFLWTIDRRPAAIASIYRWYHPFKDSTVEVVSVSQQPLEAKEDGSSKWQTAEAGLRFAELSGAPAPADSLRGRASQMRSLARDFTAELADKRSGDEVVRKLRLLEQPAYRYESPTQQVLDGALFAFVESTDPEAWLILEAIHSPGGSSWRFALARMNADAMRMRRGDSLVQEWPGLRQVWRDKTRPYFMFNFDPQAALAKSTAKEKE